MDPVVAREAFETALTEQSPGFGTFFLARLLELDITYGEESCRIAFPIRSHFFNPGGTLHGGIIATVMDVSMGHLLRHVSGAGSVTLQMNIQYLRPLTEGRALCEGRVLRRGRTVAYLESRMSGADGRLAAIATSTWQPREPDAGARR